MNIGDMIRKMDNEYMAEFLIDMLDENNNVGMSSYDIPSPYGGYIGEGITSESEMKEFLDREIEEDEDEL